MDQVSRTSREICGRTVVVDTPGFDDNVREDLDILKLIADWLVEAYMRRDAIAVLIYVHDISVDRFHASAVKNLELFKGLTGQYSFSNVVIGTTKSNRLALVPGGVEERLRNLTDTKWASLVEGGATVGSLDGDFSSVAEILLNCMNKPDYMPVLLQVELILQHMGLQKTAAGRSLLHYTLNRVLGNGGAEAHDLLIDHKKVKAAIKKLEEDDKQASLNEMTTEKVKQLMIAEESRTKNPKNRTIGSALKRVSNMVASFLKDQH
ncbi:hypothetical protein CVT24_011560 [Panaeolus cyanescens]|uniref:G domain-containing protein n=1 Tax=Panaeolus cyanescens TaxID=181874 RepID=A0A409VLV7_9AGAR|nr:hypothetical protein CVT24_011560 [Panaeolus cyanescens]